MNFAINDDAQQYDFFLQLANEFAEAGWWAI